LQANAALALERAAMTHDEAHREIRAIVEREQADRQTSVSEG
jgi:hypothetical protein